jgi:hypothetical protein
VVQETYRVRKAVKVIETSPRSLISWIQYARAILPQTSSKRGANQADEPIRWFAS